MMGRVQGPRLSSGRKSRLTSRGKGDETWGSELHEEKLHLSLRAKAYEGLAPDADPELRIYTRRWIVRHGDKEVIVYAKMKEEASAVGASYFSSGDTPLKVREAGHIDWVVIEPGTPKERVAQRLVLPVDEELAIRSSHEDNRRSFG